MNPQTKSHTSLIVICVTWLGSLAGIGGAWLLWKGFTGGSELVLAMSSAISGLIGFLGGRAMVPPAPDITLTAQPLKAELTQPQPEKKENQ